MRRRPAPATTNAGSTTCNSGGPGAQANTAQRATGKQGFISASRWRIADTRNSNNAAGSTSSVAATPRTRCARRRGSARKRDRRLELGPETGLRHGEAWRRAAGRGRSPIPPAVANRSHRQKHRPHDYPCASSSRPASTSTPQSHGGGPQGSVNDEKSYAADNQHLYPQIKKALHRRNGVQGRPAAVLNPGQSLERASRWATRAGAAAAQRRFINDIGGALVYVVDAAAVRAAARGGVGRRNTARSSARRPGGGER